MNSEIPRQSDTPDPQFLVQVHVKPLFGTEDEMKAAFAQLGVPPCHSIILHDKFGFVRFTSQASADLFTEKLNGVEINGVKLHVELSKKGRLENGPPSRRLHISGYAGKSRSDVTERDIWNVAAPHGFVRRVVFQSTYAFVDYDTVDEAVHALAEINKATINGRKLVASFAKTIPRASNSAMSIQLTDLVPPGSEFWTYLSDVVHFRKEY